MGRGRVELRKIENKINRQVTFSKRRSGFLKKASEISVLCDVEVAVIILSPIGKLFEYSTDTCMEKILERYETQTYAETQLNSNDPESQGKWSLEHAKLQAKLDVIQKNQRQFMGDDIDTLKLKEVLNLENQIETALKHIRSRKNQLINETIYELQKKDKALEEANTLLAKKIKSKEKRMERNNVEQQNVDMDSSSSRVQSQDPVALNITSEMADEGDGTDAEGISFRNKNNTVMPSWMFQHPAG